MLNLVFHKNQDKMDLMSLLYFILIGLVAGWAASKIMKSPHGILMNIIIGIVGGLIGGWVFGLLGLKAYGLIGSLITAIIGAVILLAIAGMVKKK
jgi:uncharacterized membrane protein YeaQ/YmgE (transglycosylase-associated protein family)